LLKSDHHVLLQNQEKNEGEDELSVCYSSTGETATQLLRWSRPLPLLTTFTCARRAAASVAKAQAAAGRLEAAPSSLSRRAGRELIFLLFPLSSSASASPADFFALATP